MDFKLQYCGPQTEIEDDDFKVCKTVENVGENDFMSLHCKFTCQLKWKRIMKDFQDLYIIILSIIIPSLLASPILFKMAPEEPSGSLPCAGPLGHLILN